MEKFSLRRLSAVCLPLSLLVAGCGISDTKDEERKTVDISEPSGISAEYFDDGTRLLHMPSGYMNIIQVCDGLDLVDETASLRWASSVSRSVNHPACADGQLTPSDFPAPVNG